MFGTSITIHFSQSLIRGKGLTQTINLTPKNSIGKIEFFCVKGKVNTLIKRPNNSVK